MNKKLIISIVGCLALSLCAVGTYLFTSYSTNSASTNLAYNENPDVSKKVVGSNELLASKMAPVSIDDITKYADLIVIGTVVSKPTNKQIDFPFPNDEMKKGAMGTSKEVPKVNLACTQIKVSEVLYGKLRNANSNEITLAQIGQAGNDSGETKVVNGQKYLLVLQNHPDDINRYSSAIAEEGIFKINSKKAKSILGSIEETTTSLSDDKFTSRYDDVSLDVLKKDIKNGKKSH